MTFAQSSLKALGRSWKCNSHWTRKARSFFASVPLKVLGSQTQVRDDDSLARRELQANRLTAPARLLRTMRVGSAWGGRSSSLKSEVVIVEVGVVRIVPRIITGTFVTRRTTCRGNRFTTREGVFVVAGGGGGRQADAEVGWTEGRAGVKDGAEL